MIEGYNARDIPIEFDFGTPGDNKLSCRHENKTWFEYSAAEYLAMANIVCRLNLPDRILLQWTKFQCQKK